MSVFAALLLLMADPSAADIARRAADTGAPAGLRERVTMTINDGKGGVRLVAMVVISRKGKNGAEGRLEMTAPKDEAGMVLLSLAGGTEQHVWLPTLKRTRRIAGTQRTSAFVGSDFTYEDLAERPLDKVDFTRLPDEEVAGRACYVLEGRGHPDLETGYGRTVADITQDGFLTLRVRFFDKAGGEVKTLEVDPSQVEVKGEVRIPRRLEMRSPGGHRTLLQVEKVEIDPKLDDSLLEPASQDTG